MKKLLVLIPLMIFACTKKEVTSENIANNDSAIVSDQNVIDNKMDSAANGIVSLDENNASNESFKTVRAIDGDSIIQNINAEKLPLTITDEFTNDRQKLIIKINNFTGKEIVGKVTSNNSDMNIRFNQIKLPNGDYDGPFGADLDYKIEKPGEIWLIIGKNLMASGKPTGKFTVTLK